MPLIYDTFTILFMYLTNHVKVRKDFPGTFLLSHVAFHFGLSLNLSQCLYLKVFGLKSLVSLHLYILTRCTRTRRAGPRSRAPTSTTAQNPGPGRRRGRERTRKEREGGNQVGEGEN